MVSLVWLHQRFVLYGELHHSGPLLCTLPTDVPQGPDLLLTHLYANVGFEMKKMHFHGGDFEET